jgi:hypothetical protein
MQGDPVSDFGAVALLSLTGLFGFAIRSRCEGREADCEFVLNLPLHGAPENRREAILRSLLDDRAKVVRFLLFLLGLEDAQRHWCARDATGPSVIRVFAKGTRPPLLDALLELPVTEISRLRSKAEFERWYERQLEKVARSLRKTNRGSQRVYPGIKWGHAAKVLSIYLRNLILHSRFFPNRVVHRVKPWLFVPVDSYTIKNLKGCGVEPPFNHIREIATRGRFYFAQNLLGERCPRGVARIVFDDGWADRGEDPFP